MNAEELVPRLGVCAEIFRGDVEGSGGPGLFLRDVDGTEPGVRHPFEGDEVAALIDDCDIHGLADLFCFFLGCGDDTPRIRKLNHDFHFLSVRGEFAHTALDAFSEVFDALRIDCGPIRESGHPACESSAQRSKQLPGHA